MCAISGGCAHLLLEIVEVEVTHHGQEEPDQLASDRGGSDLVGLSCSETMEEREQAVLALPGMGDDDGVLARLAPT